MIDIASWFCLSVVGFVCACVIHPIHIALPTSGRIATTILPSCLRGTSFTLNDVSAPPIGVVILRFFDVLPLGDLLTCLVSVGGVKPWQVLLIFFTLAYASISVDVTGFSKYVALKTLKAFHTPSASSGMERGSVASSAPSTPTTNTNHTNHNNKLLIVVYLLSGVLALVASNDVVVLTLTPVLIHFCRSNKIDPIPVLLVEYYAANTWSAFLEIGNPTNIILGQGLDLSFVEYLKLSVIPTTVTIVSSLGFVAMMPPPVPTQPKYDVECCAPNVGEDIVVTREGEVEVEMEVSSLAPPSASSCPTPTTMTITANDETVGLAASSVHPNVEVEMNDTSIPPPMEVAPSDIVLVDTAAALDADVELELADPFGAKFGSAVLAVGILLLCLSSYVPSVPLAAVTTAMCVVLCVRDYTILSTDPREYPLGISRIRQVGRRMPWGVAPYAICMFILVDALERNHWIDTLADSFVSLCRQGGPVVASTIMMGLTVLIVNLFNNQPAAILLSSALVKSRNMLLVDPTTTPTTSITTTATASSSSTSTSANIASNNTTSTLGVAVPPYAKEEISGIVSSVALGANIGACFTVAGALAGFMWLSILREHHLDVSWVSFAVAGAKFMVIPAVLGGIASGLQSYVGMGM